MRITKYGHCCLLIEQNGTRILTDPGIYSSGQDDLKNIDIILITHEHTDHIHTESVKAIVKNNPKVSIITNSAVSPILQKENVQHRLIENGNIIQELGISIEAFQQKHALMYEGFPQVENTGFFIQNKLFFPGDAFIEPKKPVEILALPVAGPWMKLSEAIDYAKKIKPKICFPVHDGILKQPGMVHRIPQAVCEKEGIVFKILEHGKPVEF